MYSWNYKDNECSLCIHKSPLSSVRSSPHNHTQLLYDLLQHYCFMTARPIKWLRLFTSVRLTFCIHSSYFLHEIQALFVLFVLTDFISPTISEEHKKLILVLRYLRTCSCYFLSVTVHWIIINIRTLYFCKGFFGPLYRTLLKLFRLGHEN